MRTPELLKRLDRRVLPPIGRVLARLDRGARRLRAARAAAVLLSLAVVLLAVYAAGRSPAADNGPSGASIRLGVAEGGSIRQYVTDSHAKLAKLISDSATTASPPKFFALVSFSAYLTPDRLTPVLAGLPLQVTNVIMRVPSDEQTQIVTIDAFAIPQDVIRGMAATATQKAQDVTDSEVLLRNVEGTTSEDEALRSTYTLRASVDRLEETAYQHNCGCVYAAVVYATPTTLGALAAEPDVRVVEPAPRDQLLDRAVFWPPFPDQHGLAEPPGPSPSAASGR